MPRCLSLQLMGTVACAMLFPASIVYAEQTIRCKSENREYQYCSIKTHNRVELVRQYSHTSCRKGSNWGFDRHGVWVDRGCEAEFQVGRHDPGEYSAGTARTIRCKSSHGQRHYCRGRTDNRVTLVRQYSDTRCRKGSNWGFDRDGVWVDDGCEAEFRIGRGDGHAGRNRDDDSGNDNAIAAGAALAGLAIVAALASHEEKHQADIPPWAVGTFFGYDDLEGKELKLTVLPGGSVTGYADQHQFSGKLDGARLETGRHRFTIARSGNGFVATDLTDSAHKVRFRHNAPGY